LSSHSIGQKRAAVQQLEQRKKTISSSLWLALDQSPASSEATTTYGASIVVANRQLQLPLDSQRHTSSSFTNQQQRQLKQKNLLARSNHACLRAAFAACRYYQQQLQQR
jgi:hypothetical protein